MKIALLHEMLIKQGGAEKVLENWKNLFPNAPIYTLIYDEKNCGKVFPKECIHPSCFRLSSQKVYRITKKQRLCLPFMYKSAQKLDFSGYDIVLVSSSGFAHALQKAGAKSIVYYHAPARYMWDWTHEYRREINMLRGIRGFLYGWYMKGLRIKDFESAQHHDIILANSATTQKRIGKYYRKKSKILYPPIETQRFAAHISEDQKNRIIGNIGEQLIHVNGAISEIIRQKKYYIILSALTEFKRLDVAIKSFTRLPDIPLIIIGAGEYKNALEKLSTTAKNIYFVGAQYDDDLVTLVQNSLGLIFPGEEDFGIVPIEVMAAGKPVFALHKGGLTETVIAGKTGDFFTDPEGSDFIEKFTLFHTNNLSGKYSPQECKKRAKQYDRVKFEQYIQQLLQKIS